MDRSKQKAGTDAAPRCKACGSTNAVKDAWASFNSTHGEWGLEQFFDHEYCLDCDADTKLAWPI